MKIKSSELKGKALDWAVAVAEGRAPSLHEYSKGDGQWFILMQTGVYRTVCAFSESWAQGGPIIDREDICIKQGKYIPTSAYIYKGDGYAAYLQGDTPLIAAMRCYVASKLGDVVDVPGELM